MCPDKRNLGINYVKGVLIRGHGSDEWLWESAPYLLVRRRDILGTLGLSTEDTLRSVAAQEFNGIESPALRGHEYCTVDAVSSASLCDQCWGLVGGPCGEIGLSRVQQRFNATVFERARRFKRGQFVQKLSLQMINRDYGGLLDWDKCQGQTEDWLQTRKESSQKTDINFTEAVLHQQTNTWRVQEAHRMVRQWLLCLGQEI